MTSFAAEYVVLDDEDTFSPLGKRTTVVRFHQEDLDKQVDEEGTVTDLLDNGKMSDCIDEASQELRIDRLVDLYDWCEEHRLVIPELQEKLQKLFGSE